MLNYGQLCTLKIQGKVLDEHTGKGLENATIYIEELQTGALADSNGNFIIHKLCKGEYHLRLSHIGCNGMRLFLNLTKDTFLNLSLHHHSEFTNEVGIHKKKKVRSTSVSSTLDRNDITDKGDKALADIVEDVQGVSVLKSGAGVSKPVIHGMYGNRVAVINNGIEQGGQQWGNDHAPEIDPFVAHHIAVVKGASALEYSSDALGGVILIESEEIPNEPHLHGRIHSIGQTNGRGLTFNAQMEKYGKFAAWRAIGTIKKNGDYHTPDYYLTNTGKEEYDFAFQLEKEVKHWENSLYYSYFSAKMGILKGSHIGNLTDLNAAIGRDVPFYTEDHFSYSIAAPRQEVLHHLLKFETHKKLKNKNELKLTYAYQANDRKEFDVRRSGRTELPALSMQKTTNFMKGVYTIGLAQLTYLKLGVLSEFQNNQNNPETGILPLIPNYISSQPGAFAIFSKKKNKLYYEFGARYDLKLYQVKAISESVPRRIESFNPNYSNMNFLAGANYKFNKKIGLNVSIGYVERAPAINELFSNGLHQGVSGIEEGDVNLQSEKSYKGLVSVDWQVKNKIIIQALGYYQWVNDYIYLQAQDSFRLTIRGAYPLFKYQQTNAKIYGGDLLMTYEPFSNLRMVFKYSIVKGVNTKEEIPLINLPSSNLSFAIKYSLKDGKMWKDNDFKLGLRHVFAQDSELAEQDYLAPPEAYSLIDLNIGTKVDWKKNTIKLGFEIENLLNTNYKDYLNRQRYFAYETGRSIKLKLGLIF